MSGSTSVAPLAAKLAQKYVQNHNVQFRLSQGGSDIGISDVAHGRVSIGNSSRDPKPGDPGGITFRKVAKDALCVVTNNANHLPNLSQNGVQAIFSGDVRRWNQVPGATRGNNVIDLFVRNVASGTQDAFEKIFMDPEDVNNSIAKQLASNGLIQQRVKDDTERDRLCVPVLRQGRSPCGLQGSCLQPPERQVRAVRRVCGTSSWSLAATRRRGRSTFIQVGSEQRRGEVDRRDLLGATAVSDRCASRH